MDIQTASADRADKNVRAIVGGNQPPEETPRQKFDRETRELQAEVSAWVNTHKEITCDAEAEEAGDFIRRASRLRIDGDKARAGEKEPHDKAAKEVQKFWTKGPIDRAVRIEDALKDLTKIWLKAEQQRIARKAEEARLEAEAAARAAEEQAEKAYDAYEAAQAGQGTGNTLAEVEKAKAAKEQAEAAAAHAEKVADQRARAGSGVHGHRVSLRTKQVVVMDMPADFPAGVQAVGLGKLLPYIVDKLGVNGLDALRAEVGRLVNLAYSKSKELPQGCKIVEVDSVQ